MPATLRGTLTGSPSGGATAFGGPAVVPTVPTASGALEAGAALALHGPLAVVGVRVRIGSAWLDASLVSAVTVSSSLYSPRRTARLTLTGRGWAMLRTLRSWTRYEPVEIYWLTGPPGRVEERLELRGMVAPVTRQEGAAEDPDLQLHILDPGAAVDQHELCFELEPLAGRSYGDVARDLASGAGVERTRIPDGPELRRPVQIAGERLFDVLDELGRPLGWHWRWIHDGDDDVLEAYTAELKTPPRAPDHRWTLADIESCTVTSPQRPASRVIVRAERPVLTTDGGTVERTETVAFGLYAPAVADEEQRADGTVLPTGNPAPAEELREIRRVVTVTHRRGDQVVQQETTEWGWYNPAAAQLVTPVEQDPGPAEGGYNYLKVKLQGGAPVAWPYERYGVTGRAVESFTYDAEGTLTSSRQEIHRWNRRAEAVKQDNGLWRSHVGVAGDGKSYSIRNPFSESVEAFERAEVVVRRFVYDATGANTSEVEESSTWTPRAAAVGSPGAGELADGTAMVGYHAELAISSSTTTLRSLSTDGTVSGSVRTRYGHAARRRVGGSQDYGDYQSIDLRAEWRAVELEITRYRRLSDETYERTRIDSIGRRQSEVLPGRPPLPRYRSSPWVRLRSEPLEHVLDDETLERLFGPSLQVVGSAYAQDPEQLRLMAEAERRRAASLKVEITRPEAVCAVGETVHLSMVSPALQHRGLLVEIHKTRDPWTGSATGEYRLEAPW